MATAEQLRQRFPGIPWDEPVPLQRTDGFAGWACRICIGVRGLHGWTLEQELFATREAAAAHLAAEHPRP